ncbi:helix-turn-helix transcriptional regulator [Alkalimonas delamerensis]|uniref:Helix-turn-helix transcriptional regulator n=1 Tax=Alkalimonas delamerensis TaxID=265981 RepID=A0ABT9GLX5_9GAMM|nr:helix-turn-helix transcriptional regulator [Alkalimonas delamerensis]MDP4527977.1 helix-turn-helix transcriptional regulator [Alkalimonas delamerensis]
MILKELRLSRHISQEQLAQMSGLNVRTIQRIESGHNASFESLKCLAAALDVDVKTLNQETFMIDKNTLNWQRLPIFLKIWFALNFLQIRPARRTVVRVEKISHFFGFPFCCLGFVSEAALTGGIIMLATAYSYYFLKWQGDKYGIWYEPDAASST